MMIPTQTDPRRDDARAAAPLARAAGASFPPLTGATRELVIPPVTADERTRGAAGAPTTLVLYGNYSCLHCRRAFVALDDIADDAGDALRIVYRHFARPEDFPDAERAAEAASAAAAQGRFLDMHHRLVTGRPFFDERALVAQAAELGLDVDRFASELRAGHYRERVRAEHADGAAAGLAATPTFFLDDVEFADQWDLDALGTAVLRAVGRATISRRA